MVVLHGYAAPALEQRIAALGARAPASPHVACSAEVAGRARRCSARADTTVVDAYLTPLLAPARRASARRPARLAAAPDAVVRRARRRGALPRPRRDPVGPGRRRGRVRGGGARAPARAARSASTWAAPRPTSPASTASSSAVYETAVAGVRLRAPMMAIHTVAAGGGSICRWDGLRLTVGPDSAGADPGPLCYGHADARDARGHRRRPRARPDRRRSLPVPARPRRASRRARARSASATR